MMTRWPANNSQSEITATAGSDAFSRLYFRHDTGENKGLSGFVSGSKSQGDNWKGEGDMARGNVMAGVRYAPSSKFSLDIRAGWNKDERDNMRFFNYATASNFSNYRQDWGNDPKKVDYYGYNKQSFEDQFIYAIAKMQLTNQLKLTVKPYWWQDQGYYQYSNINAATPASSRVINWQIDHHAKGIVNELDWMVNANNQMKVGLWLHSQQPPEPPTTQQKYTVGANGMNFDGWSLLAKNDEHVTTSPYLSWLSTQGAFTGEAGIRYVNLDLGSLTLYKPAAGVSRDYDSAIAQSTVNGMGSVGGKNLTEWLPYLGGTYRLNQQDVLHAHYGRTHGLDVNLFPFYANAAGNFVTKGISLQSLWNKLAFETADTLDAGWRHSAAWGF
jgi:iron complex outermembrane receptor protein